MPDLSWKAKKQAYKDAEWKMKIRQNFKRLVLTVNSVILLSNLEWANLTIQLWVQINHLKAY